MSERPPLRGAPSSQPAPRVAAYLLFRTGCETALQHYERCGLGRIGELIRYGDRGLTVPDETLTGQVMHARFEGPGFVFFGSDNLDAEPMRGSALLIEIESLPEARRLLAQLGDGGRVDVPMDRQVWGDWFSMLTDRFGVQWMLNCSASGDGS